MPDLRGQSQRAAMRLQAGFGSTLGSARRLEKQIAIAPTGDIEFAALFCGRRELKGIRSWQILNGDTPSSALLSGARTITLPRARSASAPTVTKPSFRTAPAPSVAITRAAKSLRSNQPA